MNQRYTIPDKVVGLLTDIATEEFSHLEMIATMIYKLTKDATPEMLKEAGLGDHYVNHDRALFYQNASGYHSQQPIFKQRVTLSRICMRI